MMFCIIVTTLISLMAIGILNALSVQAATARAVEDHEKSVYLAEAGVRHAMERLDRTPGWSGKLKWNDSATAVPDDTEVRKYQVRVNTDGNGQTTVTSQGLFRDARTTRTVILGGGG